MMLINPYMCQNIRCDGFFAFTGLGGANRALVACVESSHIRRRRCLRQPIPQRRRPPRRPRSRPSSPRSSATYSRTPSFPSGYPLRPLRSIVSPRLAAPRLTSLACRWGRSGPAAATAATPIDSRSPSPSASTTSTVRLPRSKPLMMLLGFGLWIPRL